MDKYTVEYNIPIPEKGNGHNGNGLKRALLEMKVGGSIFLPKKKVGDLNCVRQIRNRDSGLPKGKSKAASASGVSNNNTSRRTT